MISTIAGHAALDTQEGKDMRDTDQGRGRYGESRRGGENDEAEGESFGDRAQRAASDAGKAVSRLAEEYGGEAYDQAVEAGRTVNRYVRENQWPALLAAGLVGTLIGYLLASRPNRW